MRVLFLCFELRFAGCIAPYRPSPACRIMGAMLSVPVTYVPRESPVHRLDARVKIVLLFVYSIGLFFVDSWPGMAGYAAAFLVTLGASRLSVRTLLTTLVPLYIILAFTWVFNAFTLDAGAGAAVYGYAAPSAAAGPFAQAAPVAVCGSVVFLPGGCVTGLFVVVRILLLTLAGLVVAYSTKPERLTAALAGLLSPLRRVRVSVDDVSTALSLALRFIPQLAAEADAIRQAQQARGAPFQRGNLVVRLKAWSAVFIPLFVSLYRRAERVGLAFEARCYGAVPARTELHPFALRRTDGAVLAAGLGFCVAVAWAL